jgi:hypothetical protein
MRLPKLDQTERYQGLYIFDFGEWSAVGYTADEVAVLLEQERYREGKVYRIHRAAPDGSMEIHAVTRERFERESGLFFYRDELAAARGDFEEICRLADDAPPPCRAYAQLAERGKQIEAHRYVVALVYPAEFDHDVGRWLSEWNYMGGDVVEDGVSRVADYYAEEKSILDRRQLWSRSSVQSRSADEVLAAVRHAVQR